MTTSKNYPLVTMHITSIEHTGNNAFEKIKKLLLSSAYTNWHKKDMFATAQQDALKDIEERYEMGTRTLDSDIERLTKVVNHRHSVSESQAAKMMYTQAALQAQWATMDLKDMVNHWQTAIQTGDSETARVYQDFAHSVLISKMPRNEATGMKHTSSPEYVRLSQETIPMLQTDEQRLAAQELEFAKDTKHQLDTAYRKSKQRIQRSSVDDNGNVSDDIISTNTMTLRTFV